jgi:hypothetical protein
MPRYLTHFMVLKKQFNGIVFTLLFLLHSCLCYGFVNTNVPLPDSVLWVTIYVKRFKIHYMVIHFDCIIDSYLCTTTCMTTLTSAKRAQLVIQARQPFFGWKMHFSCILQLFELIQTPQNGSPGV